MEYTFFRMFIIKTRFRSKREFLEAFNEDLPTGGLFCPTTRALEEHQPVVVELHFPGLPNKMLVRGRVVWWRSALPRLRVRAGAMVTFLEQEEQKKAFLIEAAEGRAGEAVKRRHQRIPVEMRVRWRHGETSGSRESLLKDISVGGALLETDVPLRADDELVLELTTPGGARPIAIAGKVTYCNNGTCGIKFLYRDGGGSQRLREVVRRLVDGEPAPEAQ